MRGRPNLYVVALLFIPHNVMQRRCRQVKEAKYFSLAVDSTPGISHVERLACILRYVLEDGPVERFVQFLDMKGHSAEEMLKSISDLFEKEGIKFEDCRGQSYDNSSNMSGKYGGLQALIRERNELAGLAIYARISNF